MKNQTAAFILILAASTCTANAGVIDLINPSFETGITNYNYPTVIGKDTIGKGWFSDYDAAKAKGGVVVDGSASFYLMTPYDGPRAGFVTQVGADSGASLFQTVYLEAENTYTLTAAVCTATKVNIINGGWKNDAKFALIFSQYPVEGIQTHGIVETTGTMVQQHRTFEDYTVSYTPTTGGYYNIGLQNRGYIPGTGDNTNTSTVFFDNVRLTYAPVPEPASAVLLICGSGLMALVVAMRKRGT